MYRFVGSDEGLVRMHPTIELLPGQFNALVREANAAQVPISEIMLKAIALYCAAQADDPRSIAVKAIADALGGQER